jgi:MFS family permease
MVAVFIGGMINSAFYALAPMVTLDIGLSVPQVSVYMSLTIWAGLLFQFPVGFFSDRLDRLMVLYTLGFCACLVSVGIIVLGRLNLGWLYFMTICFGIVFSIYTVAMARAQDNIDKKEIVPVSAALILFFGFGACFGPITSSLAVSKLGPFGLYYFTAFCGAGLGLIVWSFRKRLSRSLADQVPTIPIPRTSPVVGAIDPRGENGDYRNGAGQEASAGRLDEYGGPTEP